MKNRYNSFGRHQKQALFLSAMAAAAALQLTSCSDRSDISDMPPLYEDTTLSDSLHTQAPSAESESSESTESESLSQPESPTPSEPESDNADSEESEESSKGDAAAPEITEQIVTLTESEIPFDIRYIYDEALYDDERIVLREGENGYTVATYRVCYEDGKETGRELISRVTKAPVSEEIIIGTMPSVTESTETVTEATVTFGVRYEYDAALEAGKTFVRTHGTDGYTESVYRITYYRGEAISRELMSSVTHAPVDKVIVIGTNENVYYMPFIDAAHGGYNYSVTQDFHSGHRGMDFGVWYGDPIVAIKSGTVIAAYDEGYFSKDNLLWTYGTYVVIEHADGMRSYYAHLKSRTVSVGDKVSGGQIIGYSGNTGRTNPEPTASKPYAGTHLHFEIRVKQNGVYVTTDPKAYLPYWNR